MNTIEIKEMSYYRLRLEAFLRDWHPHILSDIDFIKEKADLASTQYEESYLETSNVYESDKIALNVLFEGLHFSAYNLIEQILENEFSKELPTELITPLSKMLIKNRAITELIEKYSPDDNFDERKEYKMLYTELTGLIQIIIEENRLLEEVRV